MIGKLLGHVLASMISEDPRPELAQAIDELVTEEQRRKISGLRSLRFANADIDVSVFVAFADGELLSPPFMVPTQSLPDLRDMLDQIIGDMVAERPPVSDKVQ